MNSTPQTPQELPRADDARVRWFVDEVQPHAPALKSWLKLRFPWLRDVEDVAQEALFRLWRTNKAAESAPLRSPKAALFMIARNAAYDIARRNAITRFESVADMEDLPVRDKTDVVESVNAKQELEFLADALRALPRRCRQVLTLTKIYGCTEREVAQRLGISENTVRTHVVRGMERCTEYLRRHGVNRGRP